MRRKLGCRSIAKEGGGTAFPPRPRWVFEPIVGSRDLRTGTCSEFVNALTASPVPIHGGYFLCEEVGRWLFEIPILQWARWTTEA